MTILKVHLQTIYSSQNKQKGSTKTQVITTEIIDSSVWKNPINLDKLDNLQTMSKITKTSEKAGRITGKNSNILESTIIGVLNLNPFKSS